MVPEVERSVRPGERPPRVQRHAQRVVTASCHFWTHPHASSLRNRRRREERVLGGLGNDVGRKILRFRRVAVTTRQKGVRLKSTGMQACKNQKMHEHTVTRHRQRHIFHGAEGTWRERASAVRCHGDVATTACTVLFIACA